MAIRQSVSALIADKALSLPEGCLPSRSMKLQFLAFVQQTEALNKKMIKVLGNLKEEYDQAGFPFCLLKGLSVGLNYPKPLLRSSGDIDLYLYGEGDYDKATAHFISKGYKVEHGGRVHNKFYMDGICIENHKHVTYFDHKRYNNLFREWEQEIVKSGKFPSVKIDNLTVQQLPIETNAFFIFQHLFIHFVIGGVGCRQFCDWLLFLEKYRDKIDIKIFRDIASRYALLYPMQVFARVAIKYLDASEDIFPFEMIDDNNHVEVVIKDILFSGNFGFHRPGEQRPKGRLGGMWFNFNTMIKRSKQFGEISHEHSRMLPYNRLINRLLNRE